MAGSGVREWQTVSGGGVAGSQGELTKKSLFFLLREKNSFVLFMECQGPVKKTWFKVVVKNDLNKKNKKSCFLMFSMFLKKS